MIVKICGITTVEDGLAALAAGADMLGLNCYPPSPRYVTPDACATLVASLRATGLPFTAVGVFVNHPPSDVTRLLETCGLDLAQLSGDEPPAELALLPPGRAFKALRGTGPALARTVHSYAVPATLAHPAFLLDAAADKGQYGGTGISADWEAAARLTRAHPLLLAGGLRPDNVAAAVRRVQPWGVDVASGVESAPGRKDPDRMRAFISAARLAAQTHA